MRKQKPLSLKSLSLKLTSNVAIHHGLLDALREDVDNLIDAVNRLNRLVIDQTDAGTMLALSEDRWRLIEMHMREIRQAQIDGGVNP